MGRAGWWLGALLLVAAPVAAQTAGPSLVSLYDSTRYLADQIAVTQARNALQSIHGVTLERLHSEYRSRHQALARLLPQLDQPGFEAMRAAYGHLPDPDAPSAFATQTARPDCDYRPETVAAGDSGVHRLEFRIFACYTSAAHRLKVDLDTLDRLSILSLLGTTGDAGRRERLFRGLDPLWASVNGHDEPDSPYRTLVGHRLRLWAGDNPIDHRVRLLGLEPRVVEGWLESMLEAWAPVLPDTLVEPWDYYYANGAAARRLGGLIPRDSLLAVNHRFYASLGADPEALNVHYDIEAREGKYPIAFSNFGARPAGRGGHWSTGEPWVFASYQLGGFDNLNELLHETGHAIHMAAIRAPSGLDDWPDSDTFTEALGELASQEMYEGDWQRTYLGQAAPLEESIRSRYAGIMMDVAWALFEFRVHRDGAASPNRIWSDITARYLRIKPHPELSWWAMRGQLVENPGYLLNYAFGAIIAADLRAALKERYGPFTIGRSDWYGQVSEKIYRFGLTRPARDVTEAILGRGPNPGALLLDLARIRPAGR